MAAMTEDQELQVLEELKNYLDITWDDPGVKKKLLGMIRRGMAAISEKVGKCDFLGETQEKTLLFQLVMYEYSGELKQLVNSDTFYKAPLIAKCFIIVRVYPANCFEINIPINFCMVINSCISDIFSKKPLTIS